MLIHFGFSEARDDGGGHDDAKQITTTIIPIQLFTSQMPIQSPNQQCQSTEGNNIPLTSTTYLSTKHMLGVR